MRWAGWWLGPLLGLLSAGAVVVLLARMWHFCHIGINSSANGFDLFFGEAPDVFAITAVSSGLTYALLYRIPTKWRTVLAVVGAVVVAIVVVWIRVSIRHDPYDDGYDCIPPWFPHWIPL